MKTIADFKNLMKEKGIKSIPIYHGNEYLGSITDELKYDTSNCTRYYKDYENAIMVALDQFEEFLKLRERILSEEVVKISIVYYESKDEYMYADYEGAPVVHHVFPRNVINEEVQEWEGTVDNIFERFENANRHLRYINGKGYKFKNNEDKHLHNVWYKIQSECRKIKMYYGNGIVD